MKMKSCANFYLQTSLLSLQSSVRILLRSSPIFYSYMLYKQTLRYIYLSGCWILLCGGWQIYCRINLKEFVHKLLLEAVEATIARGGEGDKGR